VPSQEGVAATRNARCDESTNIANLGFGGVKPPPGVHKEVGLSTLFHVRHLLGPTASSLPAVRPGRARTRVVMALDAGAQLVVL